MYIHEKKRNQRKSLKAKNIDEEQDLIQLPVFILNKQRFLT